MDVTAAMNALQRVFRGDATPRCSSVLLHGPARVGKHRALANAVAASSCGAAGVRPARLHVVPLTAVLANPRKGEGDETAFSFASLFRGFASVGVSAPLHVVVLEDLHICLGVAGAASPSPAAAADFTGDLLQCLTRALKTELPVFSDNVIVVGLLDTDVASSSSSSSLFSALASSPVAQRQRQNQALVLRFLSTQLFDLAVEMRAPSAVQKQEALAKIGASLTAVPRSDIVAHLARTHETVTSATVELLLSAVAGGDSAKTVVDAAGVNRAASSPWDAIVGHDDIKRLLQSMVATPVSRADALRHRGVAPDLGILLAGSPGVGKGMLARALAQSMKQLVSGSDGSGGGGDEAGDGDDSFSSSFFTITASSLVSAEVGVSERNIVALFAEARRRAPSVIFIDEIQAVFRASGPEAGAGSVPQHERRLTTTLLRCIDESRRMFLAGEAQAVVVIAATNVPGLVEPALLRHGRLSRVILVPPPTVAQVQGMLARFVARRIRGDITAASAAAAAALLLPPESAARWLVDEFIVRWATMTLEQQQPSACSFATGADVTGLWNLIELRLASAASQHGQQHDLAAPLTDALRSLIEETALRVKPSVSAEALAPIESFFGASS